MVVTQQATHDNVPLRELLCCHQVQVLLLAEQHLQPYRTAERKRKSNLTATYVSKNLNKIDVFTSPLLYSVDLQDSSISYYFESQFCPPILLAASLTCSCEPDF